MDSLVDRISQFWRMFLNVANNFAFKDLVDIFVIGLLIYGGIRLIQDTRAGQLLRGLLILFIVYFLAQQFDLLMLSALLTQFITFAVVAVVILFQPEIRRALEQVGRNNIGRTITGFFVGNTRTIEDLQLSDVIDSVVETTAVLQQMRMGGLIVFERRTKLNEIVNTGTLINADATSQLMSNIFFNKAPLHDGALIIRDGHILAAGCILPLTGRTTVHANLGTRHRAALGISEDSDAVAVVVSEETGQISIAQNGILTRNFNRMTLKETLEVVLLAPADKGENNGGILRRFSRSARKGGNSQDE